MSIYDMLAGVILAFGSMYGLGLALAWLLPAPERSQWVFRMGVAPLYSVALASLAGWGALRVGIDLQPLLLLGASAVLWVAVVVVRRHALAGSVSLRGASVPTGLVLISLLGWLISLRGYGLYLPNRDFKNHAYFVAQVASNRSADASLVLRPSPVSDPQEVLFYPLGLHTLLGWTVPTWDANTVAITAAAAVLAASISAPLGMIALTRMWNPGSKAHWQLAGLAAVCVPSITQTFGIGSVVLIFATATYPGALTSLWLWVRRPSWRETLALVLVAWGLFSAHVAEAVGLFMVAVLCLPTAWRRIERRPPAGLVLGVAGVLALGVALSADAIGRLTERASADWDLQPNTEGPLLGAAVVLYQSLGASSPITMVWVLLCAAGIWYSVTRGMSTFPLVALVVPVALGALALWSGVPDFLDLATAPWYGSTSRIAPMAVGPVVLAACLVPAAVVEGLPVPPAVRTLVGVVALAAVVSLSWDVVPNRRSDLAASLAGAGDSPQIARELRDSLQPGQTVLNLEEDGSANLYAFARVPVLDAFRPDTAAGASDGEPAGVSSSLLRLADPHVAKQMNAEGVAVIVLGTTSRYWGVGVGYRWQDVAAQPQVRLRTVGSDLVILDYTGGSR